MHSYVFLRAFSGAVFPCFLSCFFWCLLVILLVVFFVLFLVLFSLCSGAFFRAFFRACPFSFLYTFPLGGGPVFLPCFFSWFLGVFSVLFFVLFVVFFLCLLSCFFSCIFSFFFSYFFSSFFFFVPWVAPETNDHHILHFGPCFFRCFFWWSLLVKIGYTQTIGTAQQILRFGGSFQLTQMYRKALPSFFGSNHILSKSDMKHSKSLV